MNFRTPVCKATSFLTATLFFAFSWAADVVDDLKLVQLVFRHGDRGPLHTYKSEPYDDTTWKNGRGRLTPRGMKQQFDMGKFFRERYSRFLDADNDNAANQVYIRSSDQDRSLQSAAAFAAGMFPPSAATKWDETLGKIWRPVTIHSIAWEEENLLSKQSPCPEYTRLNNELWSLPEAKHLYKEFRAVFDLVANNSGEVTPDRKSYWDVLNHVRDVIFCQISNGKNLPLWLNQTEFNKMMYLSGIYFHLYSGANGDKARARLSGGNLLALILKRMNDSSNNISVPEFNNTKMFIYSAHDSTVAGILSTLELYDYNETLRFIGIPNYASCVIIELFQNNSVRISFKNDLADIPRSIPEVLRHPKCSIFCPLGALMEVTKDYVVNDWDKECQGPQFVDQIDASDLVIALVTIILVIILTTVALGCYKRRSPPSSGGPNARIENSSLITYSRLSEDDGL